METNGTRQTNERFSNSGGDCIANDNPVMDEISVERSAGGWRDMAINEALHSEAMGGDSSDAVLREIRRHRPGCATIMLWVNRARLPHFFERFAGSRSLLAGRDEYKYAGKPVPYTGWHEVPWEGAVVEIALPPDAGKSGYIIAIASNAEALEGLTKHLLDFVRWPEGRCLRYSEGWESAPDLDREIGKATWDDLVLPPDVARGVREAVEGFFTHREAFAALGFAWRRGVLLVGPPGTGKTLVCKAAAAALAPMPFLYVRDLREHKEREAIESIFRRARRLAPCILAFEDIDGLVTDSNRSVFLNEIDGFQDNDGLLIIASSNHPEKIDEALLKRPSRFDRVFHLGLPALAERREFCRRVLSRSSLGEKIVPGLDRDLLANDVARRSDGFTPAYLKEVFTSAALQHAQSGATALDETFAETVMAQVSELRAHLKRARNPNSLADMSSSDDIIGLRRHAAPVSPTSQTARRTEQ